jgi:membrane-bound metal-dependent hydrolase YbcI (DUF457 family)
VGTVAEWLTHVLLAYAVFTTLTWVVSWLDQRWVAVAMVGSIIPDLGRVDLLIDADWVEATFGVPFSWGGVHTLAGVGLLCTAGTMLVRGRRRQIRAWLLLAGGALSHVVVDLPQVYADDRMLTNLYLYPLPPWRPPTPGWYVSPDAFVVVVAALVASVVFVVDTVVRKR